jgi:hypothetical protein
MAKAFYSMDEVCGLLGRSADEVRAMVRDGSLREFRDAGKIFFKAEDIERLTGGEGAKGDTDEIALEPAEEELPSLGDSGEGTSIIGLEPVTDEEQKEDKEGTVITASGIGVFDEDELEIDADPMADTQITAPTIGDQVSLEGTGSGSGLLDLTREADDTSLGAELLDEIYPGEEESIETPAAVARAVEPEEGPEEEPEPVLEAVETGEVLAATYAVAADPAEGMFAGLLVGALILLTLAGSVVAGALQGYVPGYAEELSNRFWFFLGGAVLVPILSLLVGWVIGRAAVPRRA